MDEEVASSEERRQRWELEVEALQADILLKKRQHRTEVAKIVLATLAVVAALSQAAYNIFGG